MNSKLILVTILIVALTALEVNSQLVGGLGERREPDQHVRHILHKMEREIKHLLRDRYSAIEQIEPLAYREQTVAGTNYYIKALVRQANNSESLVHLKIYEPISGPPQIIGHLHDQSRDSELGYF